MVTRIITASHGCSRSPANSPARRNRVASACNMETRRALQASGGVLALQFLDDCFSTIENGLLHHFAEARELLAGAL
jgi:hypothetical protein